MKSTNVIDTITSFLNQRYGNTWSWVISEITASNELVACVGHIGFPDGRRVGALAEFPVNGHTSPFTELEAIALQRAAAKVGWDPNSLQSSVTHLEVPISEVQTPSVQTVLKKANTTEERAVELKNAYRMTSRQHFLSFAQLYNPNIRNFEEINSETIDLLHADALQHPEKYSSFKAEPLS